MISGSLLNMQINHNLHAVAQLHAVAFMNQCPCAPRVAEVRGEDVTLWKGRKEFIEWKDLESGQCR